MIMNRLYKYGTGLTMTIMMLFIVSSCDLTDLDINDNPNEPAEVSLGLLLTNVQLEASDIFADNLNNAAMGIMAHTDSFDSFNMTGGSFNTEWNDLYANPLKDLEVILAIAAKSRNEGLARPYHEGVAKVLKAYYFSLMVDLWANVPYTEAFAGDSDEPNYAPSLEDGSVIYPKLITLLDEAVVHLNEVSSIALTGDVIYGNTRSKWILAANSLKLRLLIQSNDPALLPEIQSLIDDDELINTAADDFQFTFGTLNNPDDRHPAFRDGYSGGTAAYNYFGHQLMYKMLLPVAGTVPGDPRTPFYFRRQTSTLLDPDDPTDKQTIPCSQRSDCTYGYFPLSNTVTTGVYGKAPGDLTDDERAFLAGYFGRDRSDPSGVPNDNPIRTTVGLYPAAGLYDNEAKSVGGNSGLIGRGDGIFPMITTWMVKLYKIEAALKLGATGVVARDLFEEAMVEQFAKVNSFAAKDSKAVQMDQTQVDNYIDDQMDQYDLAGDKLEIVFRQAWLMNFGNGFELYNTYRRTGYPTDLQIPMSPVRTFPYRFAYTQDEINLNSKVTQVVYFNEDSRVFWDTNGSN